jgi:hydroxymethylpyrimidine pyrophosphatase-like HAD family hydrolase
MNIITKVLLIIKSIISKDIYVDIDGTLLDSSLDNQFKEHDYNIKWYDKQYINNLNINNDLIQCLYIIKYIGCNIHILTNRGYAQAKMTIENLAEHTSLFNSFTFCEGLKSKYTRRGLLIDNEVKYHTVCDTFIHIEF